MKTSKSELKAIVKECLLEILSEGLGNVQPKTEGVIKHKQERQQRPIVPSMALKEAVRESSGGNKVLAEILADTAVTSLPQHLSAERSVPAQPVGNSREAQIVSAHTPEELFGEENASRWADLAFSEVQPKKSA